MEPKPITSFRLSPEAKNLLKTLAKKQGISQAAWLEITIRAAAKEKK